ncbi:hypothetical protein niasHT_025180 [Heterodera trifolii]|uniref:Ubiquitin-like domain-containing protein n=1 Tax=Heterodera trifolii TaxID=157864 RepID=A0ABD2JLV1_9BILA
MKNNLFGFSLFSAVGIASVGLIITMLLMMPSSSIANDDEVFQIFARYGYKSYTVDVKGTDTVATLRQKIGQKVGIVPRQIWHPPNFYLDDQETLNSYGIKKESTIFL